MYLWIDKVLAMFILAALTVFFGMLPLKLVHVIHIKRACAYPRPVSRAELILGCLDCFAGGVLLATALLHLLPEVREKIAEAFDHKISTTFATSEFIACVGFFIVMVVENIVMTFVHNHSHDHNNDQSRSGTPASAGTVTGEERETKPLKSNSNQQHAHTSGYGTEHEEQHHHDHGTEHEEQHHHGHGHAEISDMALNNVRDVLLVSALSMHTIFDGLAIGLQETSLLVWSLFLAVSLHKSVISFSVGLKLAEHKKSKLRIFTFLLVFVGVCTVGIIVGIVLTESGQSASVSSLVTGILQGLACGVFLYVTFFEVLHKELAEDHNLFKVLSVILGYSVITVINILVPDED